MEFKENNADPERIAKLCSALSNSARLSGRDSAFIIWGIKDQDRQVVGTTFVPTSATVGNQVLQLWLANQLQPSPAFEFREVTHPSGPVVILEISAALSAPVTYAGIPYIRIGPATPKLSDYPDRYQALIDRLRPYHWEAGVALSFLPPEDVLRYLDFASYFSLTKQPLPQSQTAILDRLEADRLISKDVGGRWNVMNLGAILFAANLDDFPVSIARKAVRFVSYSGRTRATSVQHRRDGKRGYASGFQGLMDYIDAQIPRNEHIGRALREAQPLYPELAVRELVANALIHQDMTVTGAGPLIELFEDRLEITNPGKPLVDPERMIDLAPRSRNEALASLMRRMGFCEEQGSGLDKVLTEVEVAQLPPPLLRASDNSMQVCLYGPRTFADMTADERVRACYFHAVLRFLAGDRMRNASLCERFGIEPRNAAQASAVIKRTLEQQLIRVADPEHPRAGYLPVWA
ncbi:ATP-binding protein [Paracoccus chinensis]|uniref:ATP-binding protein n=1 Tax=Paracoccus chinensis TaxID=525640 RepID=UPI001FE03CC3|nr:ATP-binding protein [Paracoccus chinensis]